MRRTVYFVTVLLLVLGFTQCKKEQPLEPNQTEGVRITLTVDGGNNSGSKVIVDPTHAGANDYASVAFENDDVIYVGYNNAYVGTLIYSNGVFSGNVNITSIEEGEHLHFYFLGGVGFTPTVSGNTATVNISDQTSKYPVISYAPSKEVYGGAGSYSAKLQNKCSIMKFNVTTPSSSPICITGMNNKVTVNFATPTGSDNGFSYSVNSEDGGLIKMRGGSGSPATKWAIVLPQEAVGCGDAYSDNYDYYGFRPSLSAIASNEYLNGGVTIALNTPEGTPLTFEAKEAGTTVTFNSTMSPTPTVEYTTDGTTWTTYSSPILLANVGDRVSFRGNNATYASSLNNYSSFSCNKDCYVYGNIMSLISKEGFASATSLTGNYAFCNLFYKNTNICNHASKTLVLPATTLTDYCYQYMFSGCTSLTTAPALPATTLAQSCYWGMFYRCTSLTTAPALLATTLALSCYTYLFQNCTSLTTAPELPATTLAGNCYNGMFAECRSLTTAPALPATTLAHSCYLNMFQNCTSLTTAPELPATTLAEWCYYQMFDGCTSLTTAPALPATTLQKKCYESMFSGCTSLTTSPVLPATTLVESCYCRMFFRCSNLSSVTCLATSGINKNSSTDYWLDGVASSGTFYKNENAKVSDTSTGSGDTWPRSTSGIPSGWERVNAN